MKRNDPTPMVIVDTCFDLIFTLLRGTLACAKMLIVEVGKAIYDFFFSIPGGKR